VLYLQEYATSRHLQFIGVDRPGFGLSTYTPRTSLRDYGADINYLADSLGFDTFTLIGYSGGGPSVLTYCALFPERVAQAVIVSSPSLPLNADEMFRSSFERFIVKLGSKIRSIGLWYLHQERKVMLKFAEDPTAFLASNQGKTFLENSSKDDKRLITDQDFRMVFLRSLEEAYCQGEDSIQSLYDERLILMKKWDIDLSQIPSGLTYILHGEDDKRIPVKNAYRNAEVIPGAQLKIFENKGHFFWFDSLENLDEILK
jgi:pimeloyl-ACP methyl ester carboxylesterase